MLKFFFFSYMDTEQYEEAVRDYEKLTKMDRNQGNFLLLLQSISHVIRYYLKSLFEKCIIKIRFFILKLRRMSVVYH